MAKSKIEWTEDTWNPVTGCTFFSPGCTNCYAKTMSLRLQAAYEAAVRAAAQAPGTYKYKKGFDKYKNGFELTLHPDSLNDPLRWKKPRKIFVNSMSDLFHKDVSVEFIQQTFEVMNRASHHQFQVLTKRSARVLELSGQLPWAPNIWMGVSVESENYVHRIDNLRRTGAAVKFLSIEPLLGPLPRLNLDGIQQVIVGGESGTRVRPMEEQWVQTILRDCREQQVAFFFKQWGGQDKKAAGRLLNGQTYSEMPGPRTHSMPEHLG